MLLPLLVYTVISVQWSGAAAVASVHSDQCPWSGAAAVVLCSDEMLLQLALPEAEAPWRWPWPSAEGGDGERGIVELPPRRPGAKEPATTGSRVARV